LLIDLSRADSPNIRASVVFALGSVFQVGDDVCPGIAGDASTNLLYFFFAIARFGLKVRMGLKTPVRSKNRSYADYWKASTMVVN
jgi:hypothetical protein